MKLSHLNLKLTISLVFLSIVLNILSFFTTRKNLGSIYPFFDWKLFSQPSATKLKTSEYRIYSKKNNEKFFKRNKITPIKDYSADEYVYSLNYLTQCTLDDSLPGSPSKQKLLLFITHVVPNADKYKIVLETYNPKELLVNPNKYDTTTIITF